MIVYTSSFSFQLPSPHWGLILPLFGNQMIYYPVMNVVSTKTKLSSASKLIGISLIKSFLVNWISPTFASGGSIFFSSQERKVKNVMVMLMEV